MKLNPDCVRDILITVESMDYGNVWTIKHLSKCLPEYTEDELQYHCTKLHAAGYLDAITIKMLRAPVQIARIHDLTYEGHQFLADIRSDTNWSKTKEIAKSVGSSSLNALKEIATGVVTSVIQNQLGLH